MFFFFNFHYIRETKSFKQKNHFDPPEVDALSDHSQSEV